MAAFGFPLDAERHCNEWYQRYWLILVTIGLIAILIIAGNIVIEVLVMYGSQLTRPVNEQKIMFNSIRAISWIQFINLGLVLLMINLRMDILQGIKIPAGLLSGAYEDFSSMWYIDVGTQILFAMLLEIGAPHCVPLMWLTYYEVRRLWDRGCTCDKRRSKKLIQ
jgi:hypothetical protein